MFRFRIVMSAQLSDSYSRIVGHSLLTEGFGASLVTSQLTQDFHTQG